MKTILPIFLVSSSLIGAQNSCNPSMPTECYPDSCKPCFCLGPDTVHGNSPVGPITCNGDIEITASALYWTTSQSGLEYAYSTALNYTIQDGFQIINIVDAEYKTPNFHSNFGMKIGLNYTSPCDGWKVGILWTSFSGKGKSHDEAEGAFNTPIAGDRDNQILVPLLSDFQHTVSLATNATDISTEWRSPINLVDFDLGREHWVSKRLSVNPYIGLKIASIEQHFQIMPKGGAWSSKPPSFSQPSLNGEINYHNDFWGVGPHLGLDLNFLFRCGWGLFSDLAGAILYGRFSIDHDENVRAAESPFSKTKVLETKNTFRASRGVLDLALGLSWASLICDCKYGVSVKLGFEQHLFFSQNQMWQVNRKPKKQNAQLLNSTGMNDQSQRDGALSTKGLTFTFAFDF